MRNTILRPVIFIPIMIIAAGGRAFASSSDDFTNSLIKGLTMTNGVVYALHSHPVIPGDGGGGGDVGNGSPGNSDTPEAPTPTPTPTPTSTPITTPTPTPSPVPTDAEILASLRGTAPPWGTIGDLAARVPLALSHSELAWVASNLNLISSTDLLTIKAGVGGSSGTDRLWAATYLAPALASIMADPTSSAAGSFGGYSQLYSYAVTGYTGGSPANVGALQPTTTTGTPPPASVTYMRSTFDATKWQEILSYPLSTSEKANIQTILSGSTGFNASVTPSVRSALLAQLALLTPAF